MDSRQIRLFHSNYNIDFHNIPQVCSDLAENEFTKWDWDLVSKIKGDVKSCVWLKDLLNNNGFFAQMGIGSIVETLTKLQNLLGMEYVITQDDLNEVIERYEKMGSRLYFKRIYN